MLNKNGRVFRTGSIGRIDFVTFSRLNVQRISFGFILLAVSFSGCGFTLAPPGFVHEHRHGLWRGWFDWNSRRRPSFTLERYDRLPPESARVKLFRWQHAGGVERQPEIEIVQASEARASEIPQTPGSSPPQTRDFRGEEDEPVEVPPPPAPPSDRDPVFPNEFTPPGRVPPLEFDQETIAERYPTETVSAENEIPEVHVELSFAEVEANRESEPAAEYDSQADPECNLPALLAVPVP